MNKPKYQITAFDGSGCGFFVSLFQAVGMTACGRKLHFRRKLHGWKVSDAQCFRAPEEQEEDLLCIRTDDFSFPATINASVLRHVVGPQVEFSPNALLPFSLDDPDEVAALLAAGADPNHVPGIIHECTNQTVMGRLPIVLIDASIQWAAERLSQRLSDCTEIPSSAVDSLERLTGFQSTKQHEFRPTDIRENIIGGFTRLERLVRVRNLLVEAGALEVQDFFRAVRTYCFDEAARLLSDGVPVDALQTVGCPMLTERILARDDAAVEWLLNHGANPNFSPSPSEEMSNPDSIDVLEPVRKIYTSEHPRLLQLCTFDDLLKHRRYAFNDLSNEMVGAADGRAYPSPFHPLVASLITDNQPAFNMLLARGADVHAVSMFHRCMPPDWAFERLASLEIDWQQPFGKKNYSAFMFWQLQPDSDIKSRAIELWKKFASPSDLRHLEESWALLKDRLPGTEE